MKSVKPITKKAPRTEQKKSRTAHEFIDASVDDVRFFDELDRKLEEDLFDEIQRCGVIRTY